MSEDQLSGFRIRQDADQRLDALLQKVRYDLDCLDYPNLDWLPQKQHDSGAHVHDVVIVGAGQGGLSAGLALWRERVRNVVIIDKAPAGREGPWINFARMRTLRTPKYLTGPDLGIADLTFRSWYNARFDDPEWDAMQRIPRTMWMDYLNWFRQAIDVPIWNDTVVETIEDDGSDILRVVCRRANGAVVLLTRKVVMANGLEGSGQWQLPEHLVADLPKDRYAHTSEPTDFSKFGSRRIAVLGIGASSADAAAEALEAGAEQVELFYRRTKPASGERRRWIENNGFLRHFAELDDARRWRAIRTHLLAGTPAPAWSMDRINQHSNVAFHPGEGWTATKMSPGGVEVITAKGHYVFDMLLFGTGIVVDLDLRPELVSFHGKIATWGDRYTPPAGSECPPLAKYPYLGSGAQLTEKEPGAAPALRNIHIFNWGATASMGISSSSITGMKFGLNHLISGITGDFYRQLADSHIASYPS